MIGKIFGSLCLISLIGAIINDNATALANAIPDGASGAVQVILSLGGMMCLWCGLMEVLREAGVIRCLSRLLAPILRHFFPIAFENGEGAEEISANVSANLLGLGNAATPFGLRAMEQLQRHNPHPDRASGEQITLAVLNTASLTIVPANLLALRRAAGSARPFSIMIPVWVTSFACVAMALLVTSIPRLFTRVTRKNAPRTSKKHD